MQRLLAENLLQLIFRPTHKWASLSSLRHDEFDASNILD
jgi:hypothetical protein